jgi:hypothetical protein
VTFDAIRNFRNKKRKYLTANINELATKQQKQEYHKLAQGISDFNGLPS